MSEQTLTTPQPVDRFPAHSPTIGAVAAALAKAQGAFSAVPRNKHVKVKTRTGGAYEFDYADLAGIMSAVNAELSKNELAVTQIILPGANAMMLRTMLVHSSGEFLSSAMPLKRGDNPQELGSEITYMRRYAIASMLGIAADDDDDGNLASGNTVEDRDGKPGGQERRPAPPKPPTVDTIKVPVDAEGKSDWPAWTKLMRKAIDDAPDIERLNATLRAHNPALSNLKNDDAKAFDSLHEAATKKRAAFAQAPLETRAAE